MPTRICTMCNEEKDIEEFPLRNRFTTRRQSYCKSCKSKMHGDWYERNKETQKENASKLRVEYRQALRESALEYLSTHPCVDCGETDPVVLEFDHVYGKKNQDVSVIIGRGSSLEKLKEEIALCEVRCRNCHARKTAKERGFLRR